MENQINILRAAQIAEFRWKQFMNDLGYSPISTLYADFTIADHFDEAAVKDTYRRAKAWLSDVKMFTELVMVLNHKIWEHHDAGHSALARLYDSLWREAAELAATTFTGDDLTYYYQTTD